MIITSLLFVFAIQLQANDSKIHTVDDVLTKEQQAILSEMNSHFEAYTLSECEDEDLHFENYVSMRKSFSASMGAPPVEVIECCETGASGNDAEEVIAFRSLFRNR